MKSYQTINKIICTLLCIIVLFCSVNLFSFAKSGELKEIQFDTNNSYIKYEENTYSYDFSHSEITFYSNDEMLSTMNLRTNMIFKDGHLECKPGETFTFGSSKFLGDDYGIKGGSLNVLVSYISGSISFGFREEKTSSDSKKTGIWFSFKENEILAYSSNHEEEQTVRAQISYPDSINKNNMQLKFIDDGKKITLFINNENICEIASDYKTKTITIKSDNKELAKGTQTLNDAGYFSIYADNFAGFIDDVSFTRSEILLTDKTQKTSEIDYGTWVATDDRDRTTPISTDVNSIKEEKQVGMFYFLCHSGQTSTTPKDITYIFKRNGLDGLNEILNNPKNKGSYYWAEPYFGYYKNTDSWVYRKHAYMLSSMGIDFIFVDITNGATYPEGIKVLFETWLQIRKEGNPTPQICFFTAGHMNNDITSLRELVYNDEAWEKYHELFYIYEGKPLILGKTDNLKGDDYKFVMSKFTVRDCWAWTNSDNTWNWLQEYVLEKNGKVTLYNGGKGRDENGKFEELALCIGHHPTTSKGRSFANKIFPVTGNDYGFSLDSGAGIGLSEGYKAIKILDPKVMLITGWNEWEAGLVHEGENNNFAGMSSPTSFYMVDTFNTEYSRDGEPMKLRDSDEKIGFGDNYYYQLCQIVRDFKGWYDFKEATNQISIQMDDNSSWENVGPSYEDNTGDADLRSEESYFSGFTYVNKYARNDIDYCKVSQDDKYIYFYIKCTNDIIKENDSSFMNIFMDIDNNNNTGWEGFDIVIGRENEGFYRSVESLQKSWTGEHIGQSLYTIDGKEMVVRLSKEVIGFNNIIKEFKFKIADNSTVSGDIMEFMDLGDTAPNDRFSFLYKYSGNVQTASDTSYLLRKIDGTDDILRDETTPIGNHEKGDLPTLKTKINPVILSIIIATGLVLVIVTVSVIIILKRRSKGDYL